MNIGGKIQYEIIIALPAISQASILPIKVEMHSAGSALETIFHICNPRIEAVGSEVSTSGETVNLINDGTIDNKLIKGSVEFDVHTNDQEPVTNETTVSILFTAMLTPDVIPIQSGANIISSVTYGTDQKYIWVGAKDVAYDSTTKKVAQQAFGEITSSISSLKQGETKLLEVDLFSQHVGTSFSVEVFNPTGLDDRFHIGRPAVEWGKNFGCQAPDLGQVYQSKSLTDLNFQKAVYTYPVLLNEDVGDVVEESANEIKVLIPITAMKGITIIGSHQIVIGISMDQEDVWAETSDIEILDTEFIPILSPPSVTGTLLTSEPDAIYPGASAIFQIDCSVLANTAVELLVEASEQADVDPIDIQLVDEGLCGRILKEERTIETSTLKVDFGICSNVNLNKEINVVIIVAFAVSSTAAEQSYSVSVKVGTIPVTNLMFEVKSQPIETSSITAIGTSLGFDSKPFSPFSERGMNLMMNIPKNTLSSNLKLEISTDIDDNVFEISICAIRVKEVGYGLPCVRNAALSSDFVLSQSKDNHNDSAVWDMKTTCPANINNEEQSVSLDIFFQLPYQDNIIAKTIKPGATLYMDNESIFVTQHGFDVVSSPSLSSVQLGSTEFTEDKPFFQGSSTKETVNLNGIVHVRFIIKTNPLTQGKYELPVNNDIYTRICKMEITKVGRNMPCFQRPTGFKRDTDEVGIEYADSFTSGTNVLSMGRITNWGRTPITKDLHADDDSIEIILFYRFGKELTNKIWLYHQILPHAISNQVGIDFNPVEDPDAKRKNLSPVFEQVDLENQMEDAYLMIPKIIALKLDVPTEFKGTTTVTFTNQDFPSKKFHFCDLRITKVGINIPCIDTKTKFNHSSNFETNIDGEPTFYDSITIEPYIQHYLYSNKPEDNYMFLELTMLFPADFVGMAIIIANIAETGESATVSLNVNESSDDFSNKTFQVHGPVQTLMASTGEQLWVPFEIQIDRFFKQPFIVEVFMPVSDGSAVMTVEDFRIPEESMSNICCMRSQTNLKHVFNQTLKKTKDLITFMQKDYAVLDFGVVINGHYTLRRGLEKENDSKFILEVLIWVTDHPLLESLTSHNFDLIAKSGDLNSSTTGTVFISDRSIDRSNEKAYIMIDLSLNDEKPFYGEGDQILLSATVFHGNSTRGEAYKDTYLTLVLPDLLSFDNTEICTTNYTLDNLCEFHTSGDSTYINLANGITYSDFIGINFTVSVTPSSNTPVGLGSVKSTIVANIRCQQYSFEGIPVSQGVNHVCGPYAYQHVNVLSSSCSELIPTEACTVSSSTAFDVNHMPANVLEDNSMMWSPAIRKGSIWREFLVFDFQQSVTVSSLVVKVPNSGTYLVPSRISLETSFTGRQWNKIEKNISLPGDGNIALSVPVQTEMIKIIIDKVNGQTGSAKVGVRSVEFFGCPVTSPVAGSCRAPTMPTRVSTDVSLYRHFAYDPDHALLYLCDLNPLIFEMFCYWHAKGTRVFTKLPEYVLSIIGYSTTNKQMILRVCLE